MSGVLDVRSAFGVTAMKFCSVVRKPLFLIVAFALLAPAMAAQTASQCELTPITPAKGVNFFSAQQELVLGDVIAEQIASEFNVIEDDALSAPLQTVGQRLLTSFGAPKAGIHFAVVDLPITNAFSFPGHVYVTRKLIAQLHSEDELAAVLAHELGHQLTHQTAVETSRRLQQVLGVKQVGDRQDIFNKYQQLIDSWRRKPTAFENDTSHDQTEADAVSVQALARAGYDPETAIAAFDRIINNSTGAASFWSSFFGQATPEQKRLRDLVRAAAPLRGCQRNPMPSLPDFGAWQKSVIAYSAAHKEALHGVVFRKQLTPPLKSDLQYLHFSPDGKYLIAQDDASIYVLAHDGLKFLFRIDAQDAQEAEFTPDSKSIVFAGAGLRIEQWDVMTHQRTAVHEMAPARGCEESALSPDGHYVACLSTEQAFVVYDVSTSQPVFTKKEFYQVTYSDLLRMAIARLVGYTRAHLAGFSFSPDSHYVIVGAPGAAIALDLTTHREVQMGGALRQGVQSRQFSFLTPDRVIAVNAENGAKSHVLQFPSGANESNVSIGIQDLQRVTRGNYALLRPVRDHDVGLLDIGQDKLIAASDNPALDVFGDEFCSQRKDGTVVLMDVNPRKQVAETELPQAPLGFIQAFAVSPNEQWIAISGRSRGGVWDLQHGSRPFQLVPFTSASIYDDGVTLLDFPAKEDRPAALAAMDPAQPFLAQHVNLAKDEAATVFGRYVLIRRFTATGGKNGLTLEIRDEHKGNAVVWSHAYSNLVDPPGVFVDSDSQTMALLWNVGQKEVREELKDDAELKTKLGSAAKDDYNDYVEVINFQTGKRVAAILVQTGKGSLELRRMLYAGDWVVLFDNHNRGLIYSVRDGREVGHVFGSHGALSATGNELAVENEPGDVELYDLPATLKRDGYQFATGVSAMRFNADGSRLFVLTRGQTAYSLDMTRKPNTTQAAR